MGALVEGCEFRSSLAPRLDPGVERGNVEQALLATERELLVGLAPRRRGRRIRSACRPSHLAAW